MNRRLPIVLDRVFDWSGARDFKGYNKHDALNSPALRALLGWSKWTRILAIQAVMRFPVNPRRLLRIPATVNPKGLALFALGLLERHGSRSGPDRKDHLERAEKILALLWELRSDEGWSGPCWGYPYPWQDLGFFAETHTPNAVVSCFVCESFLQAYRVTGRPQYLQRVGEAIRFFLSDLPVLLDEKDRLCLGYMPMPMRMRVMDVSILIGAVVAQYAALAQSPGLKSTALRLTNYVAGLQTEYGAWYYTDPPSDSPIRHDNYHTGFILDALWRIMAALGDWRWKPAYEAGLRFYAETLFNADGAPRWMSDKDLPHDVHGAAQGLVTFSWAARNGYPYASLAERIGAWALTTLYDPQGRFHYQQCAWGIKRFTLMRWCNAWMFRGLAALAAMKDAGVDRDR